MDHVLDGVLVVRHRQQVHRPDAGRVGARGDKTTLSWERVPEAPRELPDCVVVNHQTAADGRDTTRPPNSTWLGILVFHIIQGYDRCHSQY